MVAVYWVSIDPLRRKIDSYSKVNALVIEKAFKERDLNKTSKIFLGENCYNSTINFHHSGSCFQTTPGFTMGRAGFKQPGYRSVKRIEIEENQEFIEIFSKQVHGEWRLAMTEFDSEIKLSEKIVKECVIESSKNQNIPDVTFWKPEDLTSDNSDTNVVIWEWCRGVHERQGDVFKLHHQWWVPYLYYQNEKIEKEFINGAESTVIILPNETDERTIEFKKDNNIACQIKKLNGRKLIRTIRRRIITIRELKEKFENINQKPLDPTRLAKLLESSDLEVPPEFCCPISQMIMKDPVKTIDNQTYDREQIQRWFTMSDTSPLTGIPVISKILEPNTLLKQQIEEFISSKN
jgi:SOS-response transcriptional repressor LexA